MAVRNSGDALHNGVAVLLPICQREKNKKHRWGQREQVLQVIRNVGGRRHISSIDISIDDMCQHFLLGFTVTFSCGCCTGLWPTRARLVWDESVFYMNHCATSSLNSP